MALTITGYSTALFSTWYFIEELGILFDAGDGITSSLLQKSRKIDHVFISHADRDHVTGLLKLNQMNAREGFPKIYFPYNSRSFFALEEFTKRFDTQVQQTIWTPIREDEHIPVRNDLFVQSIKNHHVKTEPNEVKSLGFQVYQTKNKLKAEFLHLSQAGIVQATQTIGRENMTYEVRTNVLAYSGDTPAENFSSWNNTQILIHEATFLRSNELDNSGKRNKHSSLDDVLKMVSEINIETLILGHFSSRYSHEQIDTAIKSMCREFNITIPVYRVLPGQTHRTILSEEPINRR
ncbi:MBL fold metallo-hydrolase [Spirosoma validum]|uniref:RNAse Z n=1 Tax=Spirosoma validum TaxID=2771355 RepID=A0A927B2L1_9BACT|nr:MBL fold metallo-hydrolase [Spirosoma validum]MBD2754092.1 RNAse Z [Spirosoma validum]